MAAAAKILREKFNKEAALVLYVRGETPDRQPLYAYTALRPTEWESFRTAIDQKKKVTLEEYGVVLASGIGEPSEALKDEMRLKYGVAS